MGGMQDRADAARMPRTIHTYQLPKTYGDDITSVGLVELTAAEELSATKRAKGDMFRTAYELAKQSLVQVNGEAVRSSDATVDAAWERMNPKVRNLVLSAYQEIHTPGEDDAANFLKTRTVQVG